MAGRNDFIVFNQSMSNIMSQVDYATNAQVVNGLPGNNIAVSPLHNKLYRQASTMAAAMGQFIMDSGFIAQDVDVVALSQALKDAIAINIPQASETVRGTIMIATNADMITGTNDDKAITIKKLKDNAQSVLPTATTAQKGIAQLATPTEVQTGTDQNKIVTPYTLTQAGGAFVPDATFTVKGKARLATQAEANAGTDGTTIITPITLATAVNTFVPNATETVAGKAMIANNADMINGTNDTKFVTPKKIKDNITTLIPNATTTISGISMFATQAEVTAGTNTTKGVTPQAIAVKAPLNSPVFTGIPNTQGKFTNSFADTTYDQGMFRNCWFWEGGPPPNNVGINGDFAFGIPLGVL